MEELLRVDEAGWQVEVAQVASYLDRLGVVPTNSPLRSSVRPLA